MRRTFSAFCKAALVAAFFMAASLAQAVDIEVGAGVTHAITEGDGTWYQAGYPHALQLRSTALSVGIRADVSSSVEWSVSYSDLGRYASDALATPDDNNYNTGTQRCNGPCIAMTRYKGHGGLRVVSAVAEWHTPRHAAQWSYGLRLGVDLARHRWHEDITGWVAKAGDVPSNGTDDLRQRWVPGLVLGVGASRGPVSVRLDYHYDRARQSKGDSLVRGVGTAMVVYSF